MARVRRRVRQNFTGKAAKIAGAAGRGDVASGAERDDHIEQHARAAQAPQQECSNA
jgi:hypothetical protein